MNTKQQVEEFTTELLERARYVQGNQYPSGSEEYKAYQAGFKSALAMVYINLTGTTKSKGMLTTLIEDTERRERERIENLPEYKSLKELASPHSEILSDGERITHFCSVVHQLDKALTQDSNGESV